MKNKTFKPDQAKKRAGALQTFLLCLFLAGSAAIPAQAASQVTAGISNLQTIAAALISAVGTIIVLWGIFEWGNAMQSNDGMMQSNAFRRIGGGIVMTVAPQLLTAIVTTGG